MTAATAATGRAIVVLGDRGALPPARHSLYSIGGQQLSESVMTGLVATARAAATNVAAAPTLSAWLPVLLFMCLDHGFLTGDDGASRNPPPTFLAPPGVEVAAHRGQVWLGVRAAKQRVVGHRGRRSISISLSSNTVDDMPHSRSRSLSALGPALPYPRFDLGSILSRMPITRPRHDPLRVVAEASHVVLHRPVVGQVREPNYSGVDLEQQSVIVIHASAPDSIAVPHVLERHAAVGGVFTRHSQHPLTDDVARHLRTPAAE